MNTVKHTKRLIFSILMTTVVSAPTFAQIQEVSEPFFAANETHGVTPDESRASKLALDSIVRDVQIEEGIPVNSPQLSGVEWASYGNRIEAALATEHEGLNHAALRLVIAYGDQFSLDQNAVFDVMRIYRNDDSERARRMAVVALARMDSEWALEFLERSARFEKSEMVKQTILAVLAPSQEGRTAL